MGLSGGDDIEKIWNYLRSEGFTEQGTAGLMGNLKAESGLYSKRLQGDFTSGYTKSQEYTQNVDSGSVSESDFVNRGPGGGGYGLAQWTFSTRKQNLYNFAKKTKKTSIGDLETQLRFLCDELKNGYSSIYQKLKTTTSIKEASDTVLVDFERPAKLNYSARESLGTEIYNKYKGTKPTGSNSDSSGETTDTGTSNNKDAVIGFSSGLPLTSVKINYEELKESIDTLISNEDTYCALIDLTNGGEFRFYLPESFTESLPVSWETNNNILGRSASLVGYNSTGPRSISLELTLMAGVGYYALEGKTEYQMVAKLYEDVNFLRSLVYPDYSSVLIKPPGMVLLSCGPRVRLKGVMTSINVTYCKPIDQHNRSKKIVVSFTITQASDEPPTYKDIREINPTLKAY